MLAGHCIRNLVPRSTRPPARIGIELSGDEFKPQDADNDEPDTDQPRPVGRLVKEQDPEQHCADSPDAGPHRVGGAKGEMAHRLGEQRYARPHGSQGQQGRKGAGKPLRIFKAYGPGDLEQAGEQQYYPRYESVIAKAGSSRRKESRQGRPRRGCMLPRGPIVAKRHSGSHFLPGSLSVAASGDDYCRNRLARRPTIRNVE